MLPVESAIVVKFAMINAASAPACPQNANFIVAVGVDAPLAVLRRSSTKSLQASSMAIAAAVVLLLANVKIPIHARAHGHCSAAAFDPDDDVVSFTLVVDVVVAVAAAAEARDSSEIKSDVCSSVRMHATYDRKHSPVTVPSFDTDSIWKSVALNSCSTEMGDKHVKVLVRHWWMPDSMVITAGVELDAVDVVMMDEVVLKLPHWYSTEGGTEE